MNITFYNNKLYKQIAKANGKSGGINKYINNDGQIISVYKNGTVKESFGNSQGRYLITDANLFRKGKSYVHRLVALLFSEEVPENWRELQIDHINGIKTDNRIKNLRWCSRKENINNPVTKIRMGKDCAAVLDNGRVILANSRTGLYKKIPEGIGFTFYPSIDEFDKKYNRISFILPVLDSINCNR